MQPFALVEPGWWVRGVAAEAPRGRARGGGVAGSIEVNARKIPPQQNVDQIRAGPTDANVERLSSGSGGRLWRVDAASVREEKIPLRRSRHGLWFHNSNETPARSR